MSSVALEWAGARRGKDIESLAKQQKIDLGKPVEDVLKEERKLGQYLSQV